MQRSLVTVTNKIKIAAVYTLLICMFAALIAPVSFAVESAESPASVSSDNGGVTVNSSGGSSAEPAETTSGPGWFSRTWSNFVDWFLDVTDLSALTATSPVYTISRIVMLLAGFALVIFGVRTYSWMFSQRRSMTLQAIFARVVGIVLVILAFII